MKRAEGLVFLLRRTGMLEGDTKLKDLSTDIREPARQLVRLLDGHPLALDQAGAYIDETDKSFTNYINLYQKQRLHFLDKYGALEDKRSEHAIYSQHPETVAVTFKLCFEMAHKQHPLAADILNFCAFLHPDTIPEEMFQYDDSFKVDRDTFNGGVAVLLRYSLIKRNVQNQTFSIHRLVQAVLIDDMPPDMQKQWRLRVVQAMNAAFPLIKKFFEKYNFDDNGGYEITEALYVRFLPHALIFVNWTKDELTPIVEFADLLQKAGLLSYTNSSAGNELLLTRSLSIYEQSLRS